MIFLILSLMIFLILSLSKDAANHSAPTFAKVSPCKPSTSADVFRFRPPPFSGKTAGGRKSGAIAGDPARVIPCRLPETGMWKSGGSARDGR
jgi:hypothetical protein